jgi:transporter family-2 protein
MNPLLLPAVIGAFLAGTLIAVQAPTNALLSRGVGSPVNAALVSFIVGSCALAAVALALGVKPSGGALRALPWYAWVGGLYGAVFVAMAAYAAPRMGVTYFLMVGLRDSSQWRCSSTAWAPSAFRASTSARPALPASCWFSPAPSSFGVRL